MPRSSSAFSQQNIHQKLLKKVSNSNPRAQKGVWNVIKAKTKEEFEINDVRNHVGNLFHGRASETADFFKNIHKGINLSNEENKKIDQSFIDIKTCFDSIQFRNNNDNDKYKKISSSVRKYCDFIANNAKHKPNEVRSKSSEFFEAILAEIPQDKKDKANLYFKEMIISSAHFINDVGMPADQRKNYINSYMESVESLVNLLFENEDVFEHKQTFKDTILVTMTYSGMLLTYEKRGFVNKFLIAAKRAFIPLAYILSSICGTAIGHFVSAEILQAAMGIAGLAGAICPWIIIAIGGFAAGFALTYVLEKSIEKIFEIAQHRINSNTNTDVINDLFKKFNFQTSIEVDSKNINKNQKAETPTRNEVRSLVFKGETFTKEGVTSVQYNRRIEIEKLSQIKTKSSEVQTKSSAHAKSIDMVWKRARNLIDYKDRELFKNFQNEAQLLFNLIKTDVEDLWNELLYLLHIFINCSEDKSEKMLKQDYNRIMNIFKQVIPNVLENDQKNIIMEALLKIIFQPRPISTASLRNSFIFVFWFTDLTIDQLGIVAAVMTSKLVSDGTTLAASLGAELGANIASGVLPLGIGVLVNLSLKASAMCKDKHEVHVPNLQIREAIATHLEKEKENCKNNLNLEKELLKQSPKKSKIDPNQGSESISEMTLFTGTAQEIAQFMQNKNSQYADKFLMFKVAEFSDGQYKIHYEFTDSLALIPEGYFTYPLTTVRRGILENYGREIETQLEYITIAEKKHAEKMSIAYIYVSDAPQRKNYSRLSLENASSNPGAPRAPSPGITTSDSEESTEDPVNKVVMPPPTSANLLPAS